MWSLWLFRIGFIALALLVVCDFCIISHGIYLPKLRMHMGLFRESGYARSGGDGENI